MEPYHIPANFTEAGRLLGLFELRNTIEAAIVAIPIFFISFAFLPFGITAKCIIAMIFAVPIGGFALIGIQDDCLSRFLLSYFRWRKSRKTLIFMEETL
ncbi:hypothetical protein FACS1894208_05130 [Clostridia bacterium]|nr:hypothetical protein FACS1894208_05130 [Clostridia bacterium]